MVYDTIIIGGGPAGIAAWLNCHARSLNTLLITNPPQQSKLAKAPRIDNYPGFSGVSGADLLQSMYDKAAESGFAPLYGRVTAVMALGESYLLSCGPEVYEARTVILAAGLAPQREYPGEAELLGRGVSYCATCDGMLYRGRPVAVIGLTDEAEKEAQFLRGIGCEAEYFDEKRAKSYQIKGEDHVSALVADGIEYPVDAVFILRSALKPEKLLPGLAARGAFIQTDGDMKTNLEGVFAAGDCTGRPAQIARAVGQGCVAALSAADYLATKGSKNI